MAPASIHSKSNAFMCTRAGSRSPDNCWRHAIGAPAQPKSSKRPHGRLEVFLLSGIWTRVAMGYVPDIKGSRRGAQLNRKSAAFGSAQRYAVPALKSGTTKPVKALPPPVTCTAAPSLKISARSAGIRRAIPCSAHPGSAARLLPASSAKGHEAS
jgi:hypothetical protein